MLDFLLESVSDSPGTYAVLCGIIFLDDFVPFAPGDTAMITAGIIAAHGGLSIYLVILAGAVGGVLGDNLFYYLGRRFGPALADRFLESGRGRELYLWADRQIAIRGGTIVIVGRFIPAGRTVTTFACGTSRYPYRRFLLADTIAAVVWASYAAMLGYVGGSQFRDSLWLPLLAGLGVAVALGTGAETLRRVHAARRSPAS